MKPWTLWLTSYSSLLYLLCQIFRFFCFHSKKKKKQQNCLSNNKAWLFFMTSIKGWASKLKGLIFMSDPNFSLFRNASWWRHLTASLFLSNELKTSKKPFWCQTPQKITSSHKNGFECLHTFHDILHYSLTHLFSSFITQFGNESPQYVLARTVILPELDFFLPPHQSASPKPRSWKLSQPWIAFNCETKRDV